MQGLLVPLLDSILIFLPQTTFPYLDIVNYILSGMYILTILGMLLLNATTVYTETRSIYVIAISLLYITSWAYAGYILVPIITTISMLLHIYYFYIVNRRVVRK